MDDFENFKSTIEGFNQKQEENHDPNDENEDAKDKTNDHGASAENVEANENLRPLPDVKLVLRSEWSNLREPEESWNFLLPVPNVMITHTGTNSCKSRSECVTILKQLQRHHIAMGYNDIIYNFMVGGDGRVYEGRGWERKSAQIPKYPESNGQCLKVAYIGYYGDYSNKGVPDKMVKLLWDFLEIGMRKDYIPYHALMIKDYNANPPCKSQ